MSKENNDVFSLAEQNLKAIEELSKIPVLSNEQKAELTLILYGIPDSILDGVLLTIGKSRGMICEIMGYDFEGAEPGNKGKVNFKLREIEKDKRRTNQCSSVAKKDVIILRDLKEKLAVAAG